MNKKLRAAVIAALFLIIILAAVIIAVNQKDSYEAVDFSAYEDRDDYSDDVKLASGIFIGGIDVGGMTKEEARNKLSEQYTTPENQTVHISWLDLECTTSLDELGVSWGINKAINTAITLEKGGGLIQRYKTGVSISLIPYHIELAKTLDRETVVTYVEQLAKEHDIEPVNASIEKTEDGFNVISGSNGFLTNVTTTAGLIMNAFNESSTGSALYITADVEQTEPAIKSKDLECIETSLGACTTQYRNRDSERNDRCTNVEVGTANINGTVLLPGESASTSELLKERTTENGYATGGQYVNGQLEDAIGGGVCQVASTLYNALLHAEIQIDKRSNHSLLVSYVEPSFDAAIAVGSKDLVFTNNLENPIYIYGETDGFEVTFRIYGKEYRAATHKVEYVNVIDKRVTSEPIIIDDYDMYVDETRTVGTTHDECKSHLDKLVYENGVLVERTTLHTDYYQPSQAKIYKGTIPRPTEAETTAQATESESSTAAEAAN